MKWALNILGVLLLLMGTVWALQGLGIFAVGMMAYQIKWFYIGIVLDLVGIGLLVLANRRRRSAPPKNDQ